MMDFETQRSAERLITKDATQEDRDRVLYFLAKTRWSPSKLDEHIREVHNNLCERCPERSKQRLDWNKIIISVLWIIGALVGIIVTLTKASVPGV